MSKNIIYFGVWKMVENEEIIKLNELFFEDLSEEVKDKIMSIIYNELAYAVNELRLRDPLLEVKQPATCTNNYNIYACYSIVGSEIKCPEKFDCIQKRSVTVDDLTIDYNLVLTQLDERKLLVEVETHIPSRYY